MYVWLYVRVSMDSLGDINEFKSSIHSNLVFLHTYIEKQVSPGNF